MLELEILLSVLLVCSQASVLQSVRQVYSDDLNELAQLV